MTVGIYCITFRGSTKAYVGKSENIEIRWKRHLRDLERGKSNYKLNNAYKQYGSPIFTIIEECLLAELNSKEVSLIEELDTITNGLNITNGGEGSGSGINNNASVHSEEKILYLFELLVDPKPYTYIELIELSGIPYSTIISIATGGTHKGWLQEAYQDAYSTLPSINALRTKRICKVYPILVGPDIQEYQISNLTEFSKDHNLSKGCLSRVLSGKQVEHKGFRLKESVKFTQKIYGSLISPDNIIYSNIVNLAEFSRIHNLTRSMLSALLAGKHSNHKGWKVYK